MRTQSVLYVAPKDITKNDGNDTIAGSLMYPQKGKFDSLSYEDRLIFWEDNEADPDCWHLSVRKSDAENWIKFSIVPNNDEESECYFNWRTLLIRNRIKNAKNDNEDREKHHEMMLVMLCDYDKIKKEFSLKAAQHDNTFETIAYCRFELKKHNGLLKDSVINSAYEFFCVGKKMDMFSPMHLIRNFDFEKYLIGMNCAKVIPFYEQQIKTLEQKGTPPFTGNATPQPPGIKTIQQLFIESDWQKYIDILTTCEPKLLIKENNKYRFIGNQKTQRGCIARYFKVLKNKGIIDQSLDRNELARVLSHEIIDFSIAGSSIDNKSGGYKKFEGQLEAVLK